MANETTYLIRLAAFLAKALGSSEEMLANFYTDSFGFVLPESVVKAPTVAEALRKASAAAKKVQEAGVKLDAVAAAGNESDILLAFLALGAALAEFFVALDDLVHQVETEAGK